MPPSYSKRRRRANRLSIQARLVSNYAAEYSAVTGGTVMEIKLSPSILSADFANLARDIKMPPMPVRNMFTLTLWMVTSCRISPSRSGG